VGLGEAGALHAGQHPRQLPDPAGVVQQPDLGAGGVGGRALLDGEVAVGVGGDLGQVGDDQDLVAAGQLGQAAADGGGGAATDPGVDLVEDQGGGAVDSGQHDPQGEHDPGQLAPGGGPAEWAQGGARVGGQADVDPVQAVLGGGQAAAVDLQAVVVGVLLDRDLDPGAGHGQVGQLGPEGLAEAGGGLLAGGGQGGPGHGQVAAQLGRLGLQGLRAQGPALQLGQPGGRLAGEGEHGLLVVAVLALQVAEQGHADVDLLKAARIDQHPLSVGAKAGGQVADLGGQGLGPLGQLAEGAVVGAGAVHGPGRRAEGGGRPGVLVVLQQLVGEGGRLLEGLGVGQALGLGGQLGLLPHPDLGGRDLIQLVAEQVDLAFALAGPGDQLVQLAGDGPQPPPAGGERGPRSQDGLAGVAVEQVALDAGAEQVLELVLAVHLDQGPDDVGDRGHGGHAALELGPAASLDQDLAGDHDLPLLVIDPGGGQGGGDLGVVAGLQAAFDQGGRPAGTDRARVGPPPEQQGEGVDDHGLAGAGLAGEHVEAGRDLEVGIIDDPEVADAKLG
jgi:hypothetical protein